VFAIGFGATTAVNGVNAGKIPVGSRCLGMFTIAASVEVRFVCMLPILDRRLIGLHGKLRRKVITLMPNQAPNLISDIVDFIRSNRVPVNRREIVIEIIQVAQCNPVWPVAGPGAWDDAISEAIKQGLLIETAGDMVSGIVTEDEDASKVLPSGGKSKKRAARPREVQLSLFD
jgi:hypothetical protein